MEVDKINLVTTMEMTYSREYFSTCGFLNKI